MSSEEPTNPFSGLFVKQQDQVTKSNKQQPINNLDKKINILIEKIFLFTVNKNISDTSKQLIYMEDAAADGNELITLELLEQILFERLLMQSPKDFVIPNDRVEEQTEIVCEKNVITYLYRAFVTCQLSRNQQDTVILEACDRIKALIMRNVTTSMKQPELYEGQSLPNQWLEILKDSDSDLSDYCKEFLSDTAKEILLDEPLSGMNSLKQCFYPMFRIIQKSLLKSNMITIEKWILPLIRTFVADKKSIELGELLIDFTTPNPGIGGIGYTQTLFGQLLCLSILPKNQNGPYEFYDNPMDISSTLNDSLWDYLNNHLDRLHIIFKSLLLMSDTVKPKLLSWIGNCIHANLPRGQLWNSHNLASFSSASDAFMLNLCGILLRLCKPLFKPGYKVLLVDPTYCAVVEIDRFEKNVHLKECSEETCLLPKTDEDIGNGAYENLRVTAETYNFITECFFMAHKAIDLSYRVCIEKFTSMSREIHRLQNAYQDTLAQGGQDVAQNLLQMLTSQTQQFLCLRNSIMEPNNDALLLQFYEASSVWLVAITSKTEEEFKKLLEIRSFAPKVKSTMKLPLTEYVPQYLRSVPEHIIENIVGYLTFIRHFDQQKICTDNESQSEIFQMILIFMGSVERVRNPHLRARLAEGLESLLPKESTYNVYDKNLFTEHSDRLKIIPNLLHVFVSIEMTGQSVQFEQKFNYRRPMYRIMEFLWTYDEQKECFKNLAIDAEKNMEAVEPPIFLRFINLLINDAIFLLDESLSNLQQIRQLQTAQDNGEWNNLSSLERQQNIANLQHLGMITKFDNILGRDTINILKLLTNEIKGIFCHESMVNRIASMLNYFLLHLVGPKKRNLKVKDKKEYEFDPANTVLEICRIYVNLKGNQNFCLAISQDGRSYSSELFDFAENVLVRIGGGQLIGEIKEFSDKVKRLEKQQKEDQEALCDVPDEFLDPIMSSLMIDPVILPSSHVTVDRSTIARHLLSDQSDPFNRSPLTMDQIQPNIELKTEIEKWIKQKRKEYSDRQQQEKGQHNEMNAEDELKVVDPE